VVRILRLGAEAQLRSVYNRRLPGTLVFVPFGVGCGGQ